MTDIYAGIDCGTNSIRLLIARPDPDTGALIDIVREMEIVRLGYGVDRTGRFDPEAVERTLAATRRYKQLIDQHGVSKIRFVATSATRDASNRDIFISGVQQILGVTPEVISGKEEAELSFAGAVRTLPSLPSGPRLVVDIGGGSTEFVLGTDGPEHRISMDMGSVRLTERHFVSNPPAETEIASALRDIDSLLDVAHQSVPWERASVLVGVAGTVTTLSAIALGLEQYEPDRTHGEVFPAATTHQVAQSVISASREQRVEQFPSLHPGRRDVIGAGALIWSRIIERVCADSGITQSVTSEHDILDGIVLGLIDPTISGPREL